MNLQNTSKLLTSHSQSLRQVFYILAVFCLFIMPLRAFDDARNAAGTVIVNRADATYQDDSGATYQTVSPTVTITVLAVPAINVTPDETAPSETIAPNDHVTRTFRICNTGNTEDVFLPTNADISAPAAITGIYFDNDNSGTVTNGDTPVTIGQTFTPSLASGACVGVIFTIDTNAITPQSQVIAHLTARTSLPLPNTNNYPQDDGTITNSVGNGVIFNAPDNPTLPPVKTVENSAQAVAVSGQTLNYKIVFRNNGSVTARQVQVIDDLPAQLEYVPNTLRLNTRALTDASDADEGNANPRGIKLLIPAIAPDAVTQIEFQARLNGAVINGGGITNTAKIFALNSSPTDTSSAVSVVNPVGVVYAGSSRGAVRISGARVAITTDEAGANPVTNPTNGYNPNTENENPFTSNANGEFSFAPVSAPLGSTATIRYFVTVAAPNYRSRRLEVTLVPNGRGDGLYNVTIRSLDGQAIAVAGGFELTSNDVQLSNLGALVFNIPLFDVSTLEISKNADKQYAKIGDIVSYRVQVRNATASPISSTVVRDVLPPSFVYAPGTAKLENNSSGTSIEPKVEGNVLTFTLGEMAGGATATITYRVRIGANATEGKFYNSAIVGGDLPDGTKVTTEPAKAMVEVSGGTFSLRQVLIGRVFEDRNGNGKFDAGERPVAGARVYLNNGQSVITDSSGQYNIPSVNQGSFVVSLDPVTLPKNYNLLDEDGRNASKSWARLLRAPLGGGALLRQNFPIAPENAAAMISADKKVITADGVFVPPTQSAKTNVADSANPQSPVQISGLENKLPLGVPGTAKNAEADKTQTGTFTVEATETEVVVAPGTVAVISPAADSLIMSPALSVTARIAKDWTIEAEVNGERITSSNIGETRVDNRNQVTTVSYVGLNLRPGINTVKLTPVGTDGTRGAISEFKVYGRGAAERIEIQPAKTNVQNGGREAVPVEIRAFDRWGNPAADGQISIETSAGRLYTTKQADPKDVAEKAATDMPRQQNVSLENGKATVYLVADNTADKARVKAVAGNLEAVSDVRFSAELRPTLMVGLAELSVGKAAPEIANTNDDVKYRGKIAFYYRGHVFGNNLLTLAYDSQHSLNRIAGRDRFGTFDPLDRAYPIFGDSSQRFEDAQSNSKVYARLDRGNSYAMFGDMESDMDQSTLAGYSRRLTGVKLHLEDSRGNFVSITGARPDTAFARDVFPGGGLSVVNLSHGNILQGSEVLSLEVRDRRNPEIIISRENLIRSVDYNLDVQTGELFFLRPISEFDFGLNLIQIVAAYEYRGSGASNYVYTARASRNFKSLGLRLGASFVNQQQTEIGAFNLGGIDAEKTLWNGGKLSFEAALSSGRFASGVNVFDFYNTDGGYVLNDSNREHNGTAFALRLTQPISFWHSNLKAEFTRSSAGFYNPFGATVAPGAQRSGVTLDMRPNSRRSFTLGFLDERNRTENVNNSRRTFSFLWSEQWRDNLRTSLGFDHRDFNDDLSVRSVDSNLVTASVEYKPIEKLELAVKREQNLGDFDPTYPNQTTFSAKYAVTDNAKLFVTQRLASNAITPISDVASTGFASTASRSETAFGIETKISRIGALNGRYQIENGINGTDSFAVIGLQNRWKLTDDVSVETGFERGFLLKGNGQSFNSATLGAEWTPVEGFRASGRYELRDRNGLGQLFALGAAGKIGDNWTTLARAQFSKTSFLGRGGSASDVTAAAAYRPLQSDKYALLFSYNHRETSQNASVYNGIQQAAMRDRYDMLSSDGLYQPNRNTEIYGRFAMRFNGNGDGSNAYASALTYLGQARVQERIGDYIDLAVEGRWLAQPSSRTFRRAAGAELGYWIMPDLRLGLGYNFTRTNGFSSPVLNNNGQFRSGFYFTITSKLSNLFDLFGTSRKGLKSAEDNNQNQQPNNTTGH